MPDEPGRTAERHPQQTHTHRDGTRHAHPHDHSGTDPTSGHAHNGSGRLTPAVWLRQLVRDPLITIANTIPALVATVILSWLTAATLFWWVEDVTFTDSLYWSVTTLTTTGYGDVTPKTDAGKLIGGVHQTWSLFFLVTAAVFHVGKRLIRDRDSFDHAEQEQLKADVAQLREDLAVAVAALRRNGSAGAP